MWLLITLYILPTSHLFIWNILNYTPLNICTSTETRPSYEETEIIVTCLMEGEYLEST